MDSQVTEDLRKLSYSLQEGEFNLERYKVLGPPKVGGESLVFKVRHVELGAVKALKLIPVTRTVLTRGALSTLACAGSVIY